MSRLTRVLTQKVLIRLTSAFVDSKYPRFLTQFLPIFKVGDPSIVERPPEEICKGQVVAKNTIKNSKSKAAQVRKT